MLGSSLRDSLGLKLGPLVVAPFVFVGFVLGNSLWIELGLFVGNKNSEGSFENVVAATDGVKEGREVGNKDGSEERASEGDDEVSPEGTCVRRKVGVVEDMGCDVGCEDSKELDTGVSEGVMEPRVVGSSEVGLIDGWLETGNSEGVRDSTVVGKKVGAKLNIGMKSRNASIDSASTLSCSSIQSSVSSSSSVEASKSSMLLNKFFASGF